MLTLEYSIIIKITILLCLIIIIVSAIIFSFLRLKRSSFLRLFNTAMLLLVASLVCVLIKTSIIYLTFDRFYKLLGAVFFFLSTIFFILSGVSRVSNKKKKRDFTFSASNLKTVFNAIDDLAIIFDYNGAVTEVNHPEMYADLFKSGTSMKDILAVLKYGIDEDNYNDMAELLHSSRDRVQIEAYYENRDFWYSVSVLPIMAGDNRLGTIFILFNITDIKKTEQLLKEQNEYLINLNDELTSYVQVANTLETEKERLKLTERIQADLIYKIEDSIAHIQEIQKTNYTSEYQFKKDVSDTADTLRSVYKDVRCSIRKITGEERESNDQTDFS